MYIDPQRLYQGLRDRNVPHVHAMGILANMKAESRFDAGVQEKHPIAGRGGYGLCQWTGPRRRALEAFAKEHGKDIWDWNLQLDYLLSEPDTDHYLDINFANEEQSTEWFLKHWERPAHNNTQTRLRYLGQLEELLETYA